LVRYADDFVILARYQGGRLIGWVESLLEDRFRLRINRQKTRVVDLNQPGASLDFLGFTFRYDRDLHGGRHRYLNVFPSKKALARARDRIRLLTSTKRCFVAATEVVADINRWQRGWAGYFRHGYPWKAFHQVNGFVQRRLHTHLARRSQRGFRIPEGVSFYAHLLALGWQPLRTKRARLLVHANG
jgi:RNA-directed DNA polymerase